MQGELRAVFVAFVLDAIIFLLCFGGFLYLRVIRGDSTSKGVSVLTVVRRPRRGRGLVETRSDPQLERLRDVDDTNEVLHRYHSGVRQGTGRPSSSALTGPQPHRASLTHLLNQQLNDDEASGPDDDALRQADVVVRGDAPLPYRYTRSTPGMSHEYLMALLPERDGPVSFTGRGGNDIANGGCKKRRTGTDDHHHDDAVCSTGPCGAHENERTPYDVAKMGTGIPILSGSERSRFFQTFSETRNDHDQSWRRAFGWIRCLLAMDDTRFESTDVQFYLMFLKRCRQVAFWPSAVALVVMLPINLTCRVQSDEQGWLDWASAVNIVWSDWRLFTWFYVCVGYYYIYQFWSAICDPMFLVNVDNFNPEAFTVMVQDLPKNMTDSHLLDGHFRKLFPRRVVQTSLILDYSKLLAAKRDLEASFKALQRYKHCQDDLPLTARLLQLDDDDDDDDNDDDHGGHCYPELLADCSHSVVEESSPLVLRERDRSPFLSSDTSEHQGYSRHCRCCSPTLRRCRWLHRERTNLRYWSREVALKSKFVERLLDETPTKSTGLAFVSFRSTQCVALCLNDPRAVGTNYTWHLAQAPPPKDILWSNIHVSQAERLVRAVAVNFLVVLASIILTSSAIATNALVPLAESLENALRGVDFLKLSLTGWGAPLMLFIVNSLLLPLLVQWAAYTVQYWRLSQRDSAVLHGNIIFLFLNTVIFPVVGSGSIGALLQRMYETEIQQWNISIGRLVVGQSGSFALRYLLNGCFLSSAAQLLQVAQILYFGILQTFGKRAKPWRFDFGYHYAFSLSIFFLMMSFGVVIPLVLPLAYLFFTAKYWVDKYNFMFGVWRVDHETGGAVASIASRYMLGAVIFLQFVMSGYFVMFGMNAVEHPNHTVLPLRPVMIINNSTSPLSQSFHTTAFARTGSGVSNLPFGIGRSLVLNGTMLFLVSLVTLVLLCGRTVSMLGLSFELRPQPHTRQHRDPATQAVATTTEEPFPTQTFAFHQAAVWDELTPEQEKQLLRCYVHPYELETTHRASFDWRLPARPDVGSPWN